MASFDTLCYLISSHNLIVDITKAFVRPSQFIGLEPEENDFDSTP